MFGSGEITILQPQVRSHGPTGWTTWTTYSVSKNGLSSLKSGAREGIRTLGLLVANEEKSEIRHGAAIA
jgi:hypothetical protein